MRSCFHRAFSCFAAWTEQGWRGPLWQAYDEVALSCPERFAQQRIASVTDIYPVFRYLFQKKVASA